MEALYEAAMLAALQTARTIFRMHPTRRRWWPVVKAALSVVVLFFIGRRFALDLHQPELYQEPVAVRWLVVSAGLYLVGLTMACAFWGWLLGQLGPTPAVLPLARAYFVGQLGKYVPGKAFALVMRAAMARQAGVTPGLAGMTAFYEVLTTMGSGVLVASGIYLVLAWQEPTFDAGVSWGHAWRALVRLQPPEDGFSAGALLVLALLLCGLILWPTTPVLFNRLAKRLSTPFRDPARELPRLRWAHLGMGLFLGAIGWAFMGTGTACALHAVADAGLPWTAANVAQVTGILAIGYVAGFIILIAPGGLGVRELFLTWLLTPAIAQAHDLTPALARGKVVLVVLLLRVSWTVAEVLLAGVVWPLRGRLT